MGHQVDFSAQFSAFFWGGGVKIALKSDPSILDPKELVWRERVLKQNLKK